MIKIFNTCWNIVLTEDKKQLLLNGTLCKGVVNYKDITIFIDKSITSSQLERLIPHELAHIVIYVTQFQRKDIFTEEDLCDFMALYGSYISKKSKEVIRKIKMMQSF